MDSGLKKFDLVLRRNVSFSFNIYLLALWFFFDIFWYFEMYYIRPSKFSFASMGLILPLAILLQLLTLFFLIKKNGFLGPAHLMLGMKRVFKESSVLNSKRGTIVCAANSNQDAKLGFLGKENSDSVVPVSAFDGVEPFRGKSGSISFYGMTHQSLEEGKLQSAPFTEKKGSFLWVLAPVALISSLILPQFFLASSIEELLQDLLLVGIWTSAILVCFSELNFCSFLLLITDDIMCYVSLFNN